MPWGEYLYNQHVYLVYVVRKVVFQNKNLMKGTKEEH